MRQKLVKISKGNRTAEVDEKSFKAVWQDKGWSLVSETTSDEKAAPESKAPEAKQEAPKQPAPQTQR